MKKLLTLLILPLTLCAAAQAQEFGVKDIKEVKASAVSGGISFVRDAKTVYVERTGTGEGCEITVTANGPLLVVKAEMKKHGWLSRPNCGGGFTIRLPETVKLDAKTVSGDINFENAPEGSSFKTVSGDITGRSCAQNIDAETVSGGIRLSGLCAPLKAKSVSGDISLEWDKVPQAGEVRIKTVSGDAYVSLPKGASAVLYKKAMASKKTTTVGPNPKPAFAISLESISGSLTQGTAPEKNKADKPDTSAAANAVSTDIPDGNPAANWADYNAYSALGHGLGYLTFSAAFFLLLLMAAFFLKNQAAAVSETMRGEFITSSLIGAGLLVAFLPALFLLVISVLGILLIPFFLLLCAAAGVLALAGFAHALGHRARTMFGKQPLSAFGGIMLGAGMLAVLLFLAGVLPVGHSFLAGLGRIMLLLAVFGIIFCGGMASLGAVWTTRFGGLIRRGGKPSPEPQNIPPQTPLQQ